ncbi:MAG: YtcA family lipoprotein [Terracidiphilus sp.]
MTRKTTTMPLCSAAACAALMTAGCSQAPSVDIIGSLFPAWLLCIVVGILLAALGRWLLQRARIAVLFPVLVYPCLAAAFTFAIWLVFFQ